MNNVRYSTKFKVFICDKDEPVAFCPNDMMISRRIIAGYVVFTMLFWWRSMKNPLWQIKTQAEESVKREYLPI